MHKHKAGIMTVIMLAGSLLIAGLAIAEDDHEGDEREGRSFFARRLDVAPVSNELYKKECGSCHFAYQPGLLPARSWKKMMDSLEDHFGDNAELDAETHKALTVYLLSNSAEHGGYKVSGKILNSIARNETPLAISKTPYFIHKHREVPAKMVTGNEQVKSFSHCAKCHTQAENGSYDEHGVVIPGYGAFED